MRLPNEIVERVLQRRARFRTSYVDDLLWPWEYGETVITGSTSYLLPESRQRIICGRKGILLRGVEDEGAPIIETPTALARDYLKLNYRRPSVTRAQGQEVMKVPAPPLYARPGVYKRAWYVDIKSTYFAVMLRVGWNVSYYPGRWLGRGRTVEDFPLANHKMARSSLVTLGMITTMQKYIPGVGVKSARRYNPMINYQLPRLIGDLLNSIGAEAVKAGAVYVHTDGYIVTTERALARVMMLIGDYGLTPRIKAEGPAEVMGTASYRVGALKTARRSAAPINEIAPIEHARWLREKFAYWSANAPASEVVLC